MASDDPVIHLASGELASSALEKVDELHAIIDRATEAIDQADISV